MRARAWMIVVLFAGACAASAPPVTRAPAPPPRPVVQPAPEPEIALEDDPTPDGASCDATSACAEGQQCRGPAGCEAEWACGAPRECGTATVSYCGCDGLTFYALENCPGQPYAQRGPCEALGEEVAAEEEGDEVAGNAICTSDDDCRAGFVCSGVAGCSTFWTCVRRRSLRCARDRASFCGCDGETFVASASCPGRPIAHAGSCGGDAAEALALADATTEPAPSEASPDRSSTSEAAPDRPNESDGAASSASSASATSGSDRVADAPDRSRERGAESSPAPEPECTSDRDCGHGRACVGPEGCEAAWHCAPRRQRCASDTQYFCGCDGQSFRASMTCPDRPFRHRGSCGAE